MKSFSIFTRPIKFGGVILTIKFGLLSEALDFKNSALEYQQSGL